MEGGVPTVDHHLKQWAHNREFLQSIPLKFRDWIVAVSLYTALHAIEALLTADGAKRRCRHQDRFEILQGAQRYESIYKSYKVLYDIAHTTRYSADPDRWISEANIQKQIVSELLYPIEKSVRKLLAERTPPVVISEHTSIKFPSDPPKASSAISEKAHEKGVADATPD